MVTARPGDRSRSPLTKNQLRAAFEQTRKATGKRAPRTVNAVTNASTAVGEAALGVLEELGSAEIDGHTRSQLTHVFEAITTAIEQVMSSGAASAPAPAEPSPGKPHDADRSTGRRQIAGISFGRANNPATRSPDLTAIGLRAFEESLADVELAFDAWPPVSVPEPPRWFEDIRFLKSLRDLIDPGAAQAPPAEARLAALAELVRAEGVEFVGLDDLSDQEERESAFNVTDQSDDSSGPLRTRTRAAVLRAANGKLNVLIPGEAYRRPASPDSREETTA